MPEEELREILVQSALLALQHHLGFMGDAREFLKQRLSSFAAEFASNLAKVNREQKKSGKLRGERLCRRDADFRSGVGQDRSCGFARNHRSHHVADRSE